MRVLARSAAAVAAVCVAPLALGAAALRPAWRVGWRERLGGPAEAGPAAPAGAIWVHAASVGEIVAAMPLLDRLRADGFGLCASTVTITGREVLGRLRPGLPRRLAPVDHPWAVDAALRRVRPRALVLIETELWPSWIAAAHRRGIPVVIASARLSDRSFPRYRRLRPLLRGTLLRLRAVGARAPEDAERFVALGVPARHVEVTGDLKLDARDGVPPLAPDLAAALRDVPLWVAGSTHPGEEETVLAAHVRVRAAGQDVALALAPRHPERAAAAAAAIEAAGLRVRRRSRRDAAPLRRDEVLLLDGVGDLASVYAAGSFAFVGGTLVPVGGHNLLEPIHAGRPVAFGPRTENARAAARLLLESGAASRIADAGSLADAALRAFRDPVSARARVEAGRRALAPHRGAAARCAALVARVLAAEADAA